MLTITISTIRHDASGEPATKELPASMALVFDTHMNTLRAIADSQLHSPTLTQLWKATSGFLMQEAGWSKWDCRTVWYRK